MRGALLLNRIVDVLRTAAELLSPLKRGPGHVLTRVSDFFFGPGRLDSIRNRILAFAIAATLVPCGVTLWFAYAQARNWVHDKTEQELISQSSLAARASGVWQREQLFDLRVFANSDVVAATLVRANGGSLNAGVRTRLRGYLVSLNARFRNYGQLTVIDLSGRPVGSSRADYPRIHLPIGWRETLRSEGQVVGPAFWVARTGKAKLVASVPVKSRTGILLGAVVGEIDLTPMEGLLRSLASDSAGAIYLVGSNGSLVTSSNGISAQRNARIPIGTLEQLRERKGVSPYTSIVGREVIGLVEQVPQADWLVVTEVSSDAAFRELHRLRNIGVLFVALLLLAGGSAAYLLGVFIVRPLDRLTKGVAEVAGGDLQVDIPTGGGAEVTYLTTVFNHMVTRIREGRRELDTINAALRKNNEELERLSVTDGLTGLTNHRYLIHRLIQEGMRADANGGEFAVLMADVDHFKQYNDEFGHPAGDEVLKRVAELLRQSSRDIDCVARYGGEEFAIVMPGLTPDQACEIARKIGRKVSLEVFGSRKITLSIGVAGFPRDADLPHAVIAAADRALYQAKREGRNRTVQAMPRRKTAS